MQKHISTLIGVIIIIVIALISFGGVFAYKYFFAQKIDSQLQNDITPINQTTKYKNNEYGFEITFPNSWKNYSVEQRVWEGWIIDAPSEGPDYSGTMLIFKNPKLASENNFQGIPIMVITPDIWKLISEEKVAVSTAPIGPTKIGQNEKYIFATPPRYIGFADDLNSQQINEVYEIVKTFKAIQSTNQTTNNNSVLSVTEIFDTIKNPCDCLVNYTRGNTDSGCDKFFKLSTLRWVNNLTDDSEHLNVLEHLKGLNCPLVNENSDKYNLFFTQNPNNVAHITLNSSGSIMDFNLDSTSTNKIPDIDIISWWMYGSSLVDTTKDINLDGYKDLQILTGNGYGGVNYFYDFYLFNPQTARFDKLVNICNPDFRDFNGNNMVIKSACKSGPSYCSINYKITGYNYSETSNNCEP